MVSLSVLKTRIPASFRLRIPSTEANERIKPIPIFKKPAIALLGGSNASHYSNFSILDFMCGMNIKHHARLVAIKIDAYIVTPVRCNNTRFTANDYAATDDSRNGIIISNVFTTHD
jgi:hypothetical protein